MVGPHADGVWASANPLERPKSARDGAEREGERREGGEGAEWPRARARLRHSFTPAPLHEALAEVKVMVPAAGAAAAHLAARVVGHVNPVHEGA